MDVLRRGWHRGAHRAASLRAPEPEDVARLVEAGAGSLAMVTLAPELPGALDAVGRLAEAGVVVAIGHTDASYETTRAAIDAGARMATHLHNACRPTHHREPGPAVALLEDPRVGIETIVDGVHLHPATVRRVAREAGERWILVSDSMAAAGCGDGEFPLGPLRVRVHDGVARVVGADGAAGAIGGSTATVAGSVRSAVAAGVDLDAALRAAVDSPTRPAADRAHDAWRRPYEALTFWGLTPGMTVVEIEPGVEGLVHVSEMDWTNKNVNPSKVVQVGDEVQVMVLDVDEERRRISLGMKQVAANPWETFAAIHKKGDKVSGQIKSITDFGIFIGLDGGIDGLIHLSDMSWNTSGDDVARNLNNLAIVAWERGDTDAALRDLRAATAMLAMVLIAVSRPRVRATESDEARYESRAMNHEWG